ncbi:MAG: hypothetical protein M1817_003424 [Caeruleum heppii]|nr:MAG: hypothetical protein M1817_003424 [Caeruleum heppii]
MGRKPNQLILEFFERGPKLDDASNRYQHTCKACGERFPKGRIDSLTTHLVKKCPAIVLRDRQRALLQLHELPDIPGPEGQDGLGQGLSATERLAANDGQEPTRPNGSGEQDWTALEALAEVSRRIEMTDPKRGKSPARDPVIDPRIQDDGRVPPPEQQRQKAVQPQSQNEEASQDASAFPSSGTTLPPIQPSNFILDSPTSSPHLPGLSLPDGSDAPPTSEPANTQVAGELQSATLPKPGLPLEPGLPDAGGPQNAGISDKYFHPHNLSIRPYNSTWPSQPQQPPGDFHFVDDGNRENANMDTAATTARAATFPRPIAMNPATPQRGYTSEFSTSSSSRHARPKVRGRFSASRRKEVQEVRKRGACMRCRMLKKPCSGESPCSTCRNVESARLWKQPCIRTRIADELELYSAGLHSTLTFHEVSHLKSQIPFQPSSARVSAMHFADSPTPTSISFIALDGYGRQPIEAISDVAPETGVADISILDWDNDDLQGKVEGYGRAVRALISEREEGFIRVTLGTAEEIANTRKVGDFVVKDLLLTRVLELWVLTQLLVSPSLPWIFHRQSDNNENHNNSAPSPATQSAPSAYPDPTSASPFPHPSSSSSSSTLSIDSHRLITSQLRSALEKKSSSLAKNIMNELERRLLQRQQSAWFETFLVALILVNAVERVSWYLAGWECDEERRAQYYIDQSAHFASLLQMLLRMRGLPPKTYVRPGDANGALACDVEERAARYFEDVGVTSTLPLALLNLCIFVSGGGSQARVRTSHRYSLRTPMY